MRTGMPFDDFRNLLAGLPGADEPARRQAEARHAAVPGGAASLGRMGELAEWHAAWSGKAEKPVIRPLVALFAGNHGYALREDSPFDLSATRVLVDLCAAGSVPVARLCQTADLGMKLFDLALDYPSNDIGSDAGLDERGCAATMAFGMEGIAGGTDLLALAGLGEGNAVCAATLLAAIFPGDRTAFESPEGTFARKVMDDALALHGAHLKDPLEALRRVGGREFAAIAGAILAARMERIPVVLGGYAATAAAAVLWKAHPAALDHCQLAGLTDFPGHALAAERMGLQPMSSAGLQSDDGAAAALGAQQVKAALALSGNVFAVAAPTTH